LCGSSAPDHRRLNQSAYDGDIQMIDSSSVRVHQYAANTKKDDRSSCMGRSRGFGLVIAAALYVALMRPVVRAAAR
jgi:hypothetical protein